MSATAAVAEIGHNNPPSLIEELRERLETEAAPLVKRRDDLLAGVARAPSEVNDDDTAGKVGDLIKLLTTAQKAAETARVGAKEPYLEAGRAIDGFYRKITDPLDAAKKGLQRVLDGYLQRKAAEARRRAEEEAKRQREEAERLAREAAEREAANKPAEPLLDKAVAAENRAVAAEERAEAKPAELARTRGDYGSLTTLRTTWVGEITDAKAIDLETLRPYLSLDVLQKAVNAFVKNGGRQLAGVKIYEKSSAVVR